MRTKFLKRAVFFIAAMLLLFAPAAVIAQEVANENPPAEYAAGFETFAALVAIIPIVTEIFKKLIAGLTGLGVQVFSWGIGIVIAMFGWLFNLGFLADLTWYIALLYGLGASLAANGVFDTGVVSWIVGLFAKRKQ